MFPVPDGPSPGPGAGNHILGLNGMDPLTHVCSGVLIGQSLRPAPAVRRRTLLVMGVAAFAPDVDAISYLWGPGAYARFHHTYTHTILGLALLAVGLAAIERALLGPLSFARLLALNLAGCAAHLLGDLVALWPLRLLWPWSERNFTLHWTGDFDLVVLIVVGLGTGLAATDALRDRAPVLLGVVALFLGMYFWLFPGAGGLR